MERPAGFGVIGAGLVAREHLDGLKQMPDRARVVAVADVSERSLRAVADSFFVPHVLSDHRALLDRPDVDVVIVATPPSAHEELVIDALSAGKAVVCEKPLAHSLASADRILAAAERYPGRLSVVHQLRFSETVERIIWARDEGLLGALRFGRLNQFSTFDQKPGTRSSWWGRWGIAGGGVTMTLMIHQLDLLQYIFGKARTVSALVTTTNEDLESEDSLSANISFQSGAIASCSATMLAHQASTVLDVIGDLCSVHRPWALRSADGHHLAKVQAELEKRFPSARPRRPARWTRITTRVARRAGFAPRQRKKQENSHAPYLRQVVDALSEGKPLPVSAHEGRSALELCTAIYTAALNGSVVELPVGPENPYYDGVTVSQYHRERANA